MLFCLIRVPAVCLLQRHTGAHSISLLSHGIHSHPHPSHPQAQNERLLKQQEVLQAELAMALRSYTPRTVIDAGTPADKMLAMMTDLLDGTPPTIQVRAYGTDWCAALIGVRR